MYELKNEMKKKIKKREKTTRIAIAGLFLLVASAIGASAFGIEAGIQPEKLNMSTNDTQVSRFCINNVSLPVNASANESVPVVNASVIVGPICKDLDGFIGCTSGDLIDPGGLSVLPSENTTGDDGCTNITVSTNLSANESGKYYYFANGEMAEADVGLQVKGVPEMNIAASTLVLIASGIFLAGLRRKGQV